MKKTMLKITAVVVGLMMISSFTSAQEVVFEGTVTSLSSDLSTGEISVSSIRTGGSAINDVVKDQTKPTELMLDGEPVRGAGICCGGNPSWAERPGEPKRGAGVALEQIPGGSVAYRVHFPIGTASESANPTGQFIKIGDFLTAIGVVNTDGSIEIMSMEVIY